MKTLIALTSLTFMAFTTLAQAGPSNRAECYDLVIDHCNTTAHPVPCASSGMDECDEEFSALINGNLGFKAKKQRQNAMLKIKRTR